jgi:hypothetical protein
MHLWVSCISIWNCSWGIRIFVGVAACWVLKHHIMLHQNLYCIHVQWAIPLSPYMLWHMSMVLWRIICMHGAGGGGGDDINTLIHTCSEGEARSASAHAPELSRRCAHAAELPYTYNYIHCHSFLQLLWLFLISWYFTHPCSAWHARNMPLLDTLPHELNTLTVTSIWLTLIQTPPIESPWFNPHSYSHPDSNTPYRVTLIQTPPIESPWFKHPL